MAPACVGKRIDLDHPAAAAYLASKGAAPPPAPRPEPRATSSKTAPRRQKQSAPKSAAGTDRGKTKGSAPSAPREAAPRPKRGRHPRPAAPAREDEGSPEDLEDLADAIRPLLERFGTETRFKDWLDGLKKIEDIREKRLKNEETEGALIRVEPVKVLVFAAIDAAQRRVLSDAPRTIVRRVYAMAGSGTPVEEAERTVRELLGSILRPVKATAERVLRNA